MADRAARYAVRAGQRRRGPRRSGGMADAAVLNTAEGQPSCGFESHLRHHIASRAASIPTGPPALDPSPSTQMMGPSSGGALMEDPAVSLLALAAIIILIVVATVMSCRMVAAATLMGRPTMEPRPTPPHLPLGGSFIDMYLAIVMARLRPGRVTSRRLTLVLTVAERRGGGPRPSSVAAHVNTERRILVGSSRPTFGTTSESPYDRRPAPDTSAPGSPPSVRP